MPTWLIWVLLIVLVLILDMGPFRWLLGFTKTFRNDKVDGAGKPRYSHRTTVYLPGILADGIDSLTELEQTFASRSKEVLRISYGFWRFKADEVIQRTAQEVGRYAAGRTLLLFGSSMGGKLGAEVIGLLKWKYHWPAEKITLFAGDVPPNHAYFADTPRATANVVRRLPAGPLVGLIVDAITFFLLVPPKDKNTDPSLDFKLVEKTALKRMRRFHFSATTDQQRYLWPDDFAWWALEGVHVVYFACVGDNETVLQPKALEEFVRQAEAAGAVVEVVYVPTKHMAMLEQAPLWQCTIGEAIDKLDAA